MLFRSSDKSYSSIPDNVKSITSYAFYGCLKLEEIVIPSKVSSIGKCAFSLSGLKSVNLPSSLTTLSDYTFCACSSLTTVTIPSSLTTINDGVFQGCTGLTTITVKGGSSFRTYSGVLFDYGMSELILYPAGNSREEYIIPNGVESIRKYSFEKSKYLKSVVIPETLTSIGNYAFSYAKLKRIKYLGTQTISTSDALSNVDLTDLCVPPDYETNVFCGKQVTPDTEVCQSFRSMFNECYKASIVNDTLEKVKRSEAIQWESQTHGCMHYVCEENKTIEKVCEKARSCYVNVCNEDTGDCDEEEVAGRSELISQENECYEVGCNEETNEWTLKKRDNATQWESQTHGCMHYVCEENKTIEKVCEKARSCYVNVCNEDSGDCDEEEVAGRSELISQENECYEVGCNEETNEWILKKRDEASEWETRKNGCFEYQCHNESGMIGWSLCNNSESVKRLCVNEECVEDKTDVHDKSWSVEIIVEDVNPMEVNASETIRSISNLTGIEVDKMTVVMEMDEHGHIVRVTVYVEDEESAQTIADALKAIKQEEGCIYGVLCRTKTVNLVEVTELSSGNHVCNSIMMIVSYLMMMMWIMYDS